MKCFDPDCDKRAPYDTLFRINDKGQTPVWACWAHKRNTDRAPDPELDRIVDAVERTVQRAGSES